MFAALAASAIGCAALVSTGTTMIAETPCETKFSTCDSWVAVSSLASVIVAVAPLAVASSFMRVLDPAQERVAVRERDAERHGAGRAGRGRAT